MKKLINEKYFDAIIVLKIFETRFLSPFFEAAILFWVIFLQVCINTLISNLFWKEWQENGFHSFELFACFMVLIWGSSLDINTVGNGAAHLLFTCSSTNYSV